MPDDDGPEIDIVVGDGESSVDEILPEPPRREWPWLHRARGPLTVGAGFVVAIAVVATLISSQHNDRPSAGPDPTPSATAPSVPDFRTLPKQRFTAEVVSGIPGGYTIEVPASGGPGRIVESHVIVLPDPNSPDPQPSTNPSVCPLDVSCSATAVVPAAVLAAVRAVFPGARTREATNVLADRGKAGSHLWYRQVTARAGGRDIRIEIEQPVYDEHPRQEPKPASGYSRRSTAALSDGYVVRVDVDARPGHAPSSDALYRLAADRRLLVDG